MISLSYPLSLKPSALWVIGFIALRAMCCFGSEPVYTDLTSKPTLKFELDIQPILTARGCNSGPCHGKARGQNGFALSLLGFDANMDYEAIVKNSRGRRLSVASPNESLLLNKAVGKQPHGGGIRFSETDEDYRLLLDWIQGGVARTTDADPKLLSIAVSTDPHSMIAGQHEMLTVTAKYNNGSDRKSVV